MTPIALDSVAGSQLDLDNPWPGLDAYQESSHAFFSGRSSEIDELIRRIVDEPITVLFGKSGLGKTSLLKAGVFPGLREKGLLPIFLRLQIRPGAEPPLEQVRLAIFAELRAQGVEHPPARDGETLWEYLHRPGQEFWTRQNRLVRPILVFDQFEEIFTLGRTIPTVIAAFREDLSDLVENRIPATIARRLEDGSLSDLGLDAHLMPYKVVLSLREDFLADLEEWRVTMPSLRRNRMRLLPMGSLAAMQAVYNDRTRHLVAEPLARTIVGFLSSGPPIADGDTLSARDSATVEPALLSLFCRGANETRQRDGKPCFDDALIEGAKDTIVPDFYRTSLADQPDRVQRFIEDHLITESGFRNSYSVDDAIALGFLTRGELDTLVDRHLLRHEHHLGADRVELTHDLLTAAVAGGRDERRLAEREAHQRLEQRRLRRLTNRFAVAALIFLGLAIVAWSARRTAALERDRSRLIGLMASATAAINQDPELAVVLAREVLDKVDTAEARIALVDAAQYAWPQALLGKEELQGTPSALALSPDGSRLAVLVDGHTLRVWNVSERKPSPAWTKEALEGASSLAFSPDQQLLAVGRTTSIDVLQAESGRVDAHLTALVNRHLGSAVEDRTISFSPDGAWLASTQSDGVLRLVDYRNDRPAPPVPAENVVQFAVAAGGNHIVTVSSFPLAARVMELRDGAWTKIEPDLTHCMRAQSVSPGPRQFSATWNAGSCMFETATPSRSPSRGASTATDDIVWSPGGLAYAEFVPPEDVIVGRPGGLRFRIKGGHPSATNDKTRYVSVSETGRRVALIDEDDQVRVYFLADDKPFLSPLERDAWAISLDANWLATRRAPDLGAPSAIDVIRLEGVKPSALLPRTRITLGAPAIRIYAAQNALIAVLETEPASSVAFDVTTGKPRFAPLPGAAEPLGERREMLLVQSGDAFQIARVRDGASLAPRDHLPAGAESVPSRVLVSPKLQAIAVLTEVLPTQGTRRITARAYAVRGENLDLVGEVHDLPMVHSLAYAAAQFNLTDDGATITDGSDRRWATGARGSTGNHAELPSQGKTVELQLSPLNTFEIGPDLTPNAGSGFALQHRSSRVVIKRFPNKASERRFSSDDRWLALWDEKTVEVIDLAKGETVMRLKYRRASEVGGVTFEPGNAILNVELKDQNGNPAGSVLVPLADKVMRQFVDWLVPRNLSARERCHFGLEGAGCLQEAGTAPSRATHEDRR